MNEWLTQLPASDEVQVFHEQRSLWLLLVAAAGMLMLLNTWARDRARRRFATDRYWQQIPKQSSFLSSALLLAAISLMCLALLDVRWGKTEREVPQKGIEVMFLLDVSRSMLAEDVSPNRLQRAKQQIMDMVNEMAGDHVGLTVFAGESQQAIPLTRHYDDFKEMLDEVGPHTVRRGGSRLGDALQAGADSFLTKTHDHKAMIVFTDGEDQESNPIEVAKRARDEYGLRIFTIGLGDMDTGARIPDFDPEQPGLQSKRYVKHKGQAVWSKMNGSILREVATQTGGAYIPAGTKRVDMADVYHRYVRQIEQSDLQSATVNAYIPRFQWFALPALILLVMEVWLSTRRKRKTHDSVRKEQASSSAFKSAAAMTLCLVLFVGNATAVAQDSATNSGATIEQANEWSHQGNWQQAATAYQELISSQPLNQSNELSQEGLHYNHGVALYRLKQLPQASEAFASATASSETSLAIKARYNLATCRYLQALQVVTKENPQTPELEQAKSWCLDAIDDFRGVLRLDLEYADARANLELAVRLLDQLTQQQQQQDQNEQPDQDKEPSDSSQDKSEKEPSDSGQPNEGEPPASGEEDPNDPSSKQGSDPSQQSGQSQQSGKGDTDPSQEKKPDQSQTQGDNGEGKGPDEQSSSAESDESNDSQSNGESDPQGGTDHDDDSPPMSQSQRSSQSPSADSKESDSETFEPEEDSPSDDESTGEPPKGQLTASDEQSSESNEGFAASEADPRDQDGKNMTYQEALKMLQAIRDRDLLRRLQLQRRERSRQIPVERDW